MNISQLKNASVLFAGQLLIKGSNFIKQLLLAFFLGISSNIDLFLIAQIVPAIISSMIAGGAGEILVRQRGAEPGSGGEAPVPGREEVSRR